MIYHLPAPKRPFILFGYDHGRFVIALWRLFAISNVDPQSEVLDLLLGNLAVSCDEFPTFHFTFLLSDLSFRFIAFGFYKLVFPIETLFGELMSYKRIYDGDPIEVDTSSGMATLRRCRMVYKRPRLWIRTYSDWGWEPMRLPFGAFITEDSGERKNIFEGGFIVSATAEHALAKIRLKCNDLETIAKEGSFTADLEH